MTITKNIREKQKQQIHNLLMKWGIVPDSCKWADYDNAQKLYWNNWSPDKPEFDIFCKFAAKWIGV